MKTLIVFAALVAIAMSNPQDRVQVAHRPGGFERPDISPAFVEGMQPQYPGQGYQVPAYVLPPGHYQQPGFQQPGFQQPDISPAYVVPAPGYGHQPPGYWYQQPGYGFERPDASPAYVQPGFQQPNISPEYVQPGSQQPVIVPDYAFYRPTITKPNQHPAARGGSK